MPFNLDKKEYVCPWCLSGGAMLWEWAGNNYGAIFTLLLRQSTEIGTGDFVGETYELDRTSVVGRWAQDRVALVGHYDASGLWEKRDEFHDITALLVETWNEFVELDKLHFTYQPCAWHKAHQAAEGQEAAHS